jgi:Flp pilus assembly protein TadG
MTNLRGQDGQVTVLTAVFMIAMLGITGIVIDVGAWFHQQRVEQSTVDAAALAGAQALPTKAEDPRTVATTYASDNGGVEGLSVTIGSKFTPNDMITVTQARSAQGYFSKLFGVPTVTIRTHASAVAAIPSEVTGAAPVAVDIHLPQLSGTVGGAVCPCFNVPARIPIGKKPAAPGAFGWIDLASHNGNTGTSTLEQWITSGYQGYLPLGDYDSDPGAKHALADALTRREGSDLLFPVYDSLSGNGSTAPYHVIGWASFHLDSFDPGPQGNVAALNGYFDRVIWDGIVSASGQATPPVPDLGVYSVALID